MSAGAGLPMSVRSAASPDVGRALRGAIPRTVAATPKRRKRRVFIALVWAAMGAVGKARRHGPPYNGPLIDGGVSAATPGVPG